MLPDIGMARTIWIREQSTGNTIKIDKWDNIRLKNFCKGKETVIQVKRQPTEWEKLLLKFTCDKELISRTQDELQKLENKNPNQITQLKKGNGPK
jgi:hypothetical protein